MRHLALPLALLFLLLPGTAAAQEGEHSPNMSFVKNLPYEARNDTPNYGTDLEFATIGAGEYAIAGSYENGMQIVDITRPDEARIVGVYDCDILQGDVQVFEQEQRPGRILAAYTADAPGNQDSACYREAAALGFEVTDTSTSLLGATRTAGKQGTFIVDITDPANPATVSFVPVPQGSHNQTVHPSGDYLYNSNADLITSLMPAIEVFDISDLALPRKVAELALPTRPGLGTESHDITFDKGGDRAYSAALSQGVIIDTTNPAAPSIVTSFLDPTINVWHQSDPFTVTAGDGTRRDFLIVEDEVAGAIGTGQCPNGGVHVYDVTGEKERDPVKVGFWVIDDVGPTQNGPTGGCTAHVFDIHEAEQVMTIAFYNGGVRVVDLSELAGVTLGETDVVGKGMKEIGFYRFPDADTWSAKTPRIDPATGDFHLFANDIARGMDIYRFDGSAPASRAEGRWMTPAQATAFKAGRPGVALTPDTALLCMLPRP